MTEKPTYKELEKKIQELEQANSRLKESKESLQEGQELLDFILKQSLLSILFLQDNKIVFANESYSKLTGYPLEEILEWKIEDTIPLIHPDYREFVISQGRKKMRGELEDIVTNYQFVGITKNGEERWVDQYSKSVLYNGKPADMISQIDITEHKMAEKAFRKSEEKFKRIFDNLQDGYLWADKDGNILLANMYAADILGYDLQELMRKNMAKDIYFFPTDREKVKEIMHQNGKIENYEIYFKRKDGQKIVVEANSHLVHDDNKQITMEGTFRDITSRKMAEAEKLMAQKIAEEHKKLALIGQIAGKMAHDFNNILAIIMGNAQLALVNSKEAETIKTLELIFDQTIRGKSLTRNLVAFARDQEPKQEFFRISEKMDLVLNLMRKDLEGIELIKEDKPGVPDLLADPGMIEHALVNLIQNSIHALSMVEHPKITIKTYGRDKHICFEIEDNGCGISKENLENIYEPSFTLKGSKDVTGSYKSGIKGTGYGMSNVKKYIEQHKGNISIESELGSGTKFTISLPVNNKELTIEEKIELRQEIKYFEKHILLVEDETAISNVQYRILTDEPCNHKVDIATNGQVAMDLFDRNEYDFVSLDYVLPGGINGLDFYHHIRETNKTIPILFISGNIEFLESIKELKQKDAYIDHLSKPCQNKDYVNGINELLEKTLAGQ